MSEEHTDNLKKARAKLVEQRRAFVKVLAGPYERGKTEQAREKFLEMQTAIEAMNRTGPSKTKRDPKPRSMRRERWGK